MYAWQLFWMLNEPPHTHSPSPGLLSAPPVTLIRVNPPGSEWWIPYVGRTPCRAVQDNTTTQNLHRNSRASKLAGFQTMHRADKIKKATWIHPFRKLSSHFREVRAFVLTGYLLLAWEVKKTTITLQGPSRTTCTHEHTITDTWLNFASMEQHLRDACLGYLR